MVGMKIELLIENDQINDFRSEIYLTKLYWKNDNKLLFDSYSEAWLNSVLLLLLLLLLKFHWSC